MNCASAGKPQLPPPAAALPSWIFAMSILSTPPASASWRKCTPAASASWPLPRSSRPSSKMPAALPDAARLPAVARLNESWLDLPMLPPVTTRPDTTRARCEAPRRGLGRRRNHRNRFRAAGDRGRRGLTPNGADSTEQSFRQAHSLDAPPSGESLQRLHNLSRRFDGDRLPRCERPE